MPHENNPLLKSVFDARLKLHDQNILFDKFRIVGIPVEPWTPYFRTNNFIQRSVSILLGFDETNEEFKKLVIDSQGALKVTASVSQNLYIDLNGNAQIVKGNALGAVRMDPFGRTFDVFDIFTAEPHPANGLLVGSGIDIRGYEFISINISTTQNSTVTLQVSDDNTNWYEIKTAADADISFNCNNEKISFNITNFSAYMRVLVKNDTATAGTTSVKLNAKS